MPSGDTLAAKRLWRIPLPSPLPPPLLYPTHSQAGWYDSNGVYHPGSGAPPAPSSPNTASLVGGIVGGVALLALIAVGVVLTLRRRRSPPPAGATAPGTPVEWGKGVKNPAA